MITTIVGLIVGIIAYMAYNHLVSRVGKVIHKMEASGLEFIDILEEPPLMNLGQRNPEQAGGNMSSMTDLVFLCSSSL